MIHLKTYESFEDLVDVNDDLEMKIASFIQSLEVKVIDDETIVYLSNGRKALELFKPTASLFCYDPFWKGINYEHYLRRVTRKDPRPGLMSARDGSDSASFNDFIKKTFEIVYNIKINKLAY